MGFFQIQVVRKMLKHVQFYINGIEKNQMQVLNNNLKKQYHCIDEIQYLFRKTTRCVCTVWGFSYQPSM